MSEPTFTLADMLRATREESPSEFTAAFDQLMIQKIADVVEIERQKVAQAYFNSDQEVDSSDEQQEDETNEDAETDN